MNFSAIRNVLADASFRHYVYGNGCSQFGIWVQRIAVGWLTWELTQSPFWLGLIAFASFAPAIVCAPLAGAIADRVDRLRGIKITQALGGLQAALLVLLTATGTITVELLLILTFLLGVVMAFNQPLRLAVIPSLVDGDDMAAAVSINFLTFNIARISGPAIAGLTIFHFGITLCFVICAVTYFLFAFALMFVRVPDQAPRGQPKTIRKIPQEIMAGLRYCQSHAGIGPVMILMAVVGIAGRSYAELLPAFAADIFGRGGGRVRHAYQCHGCRRHHRGHDLSHPNVSQRPYQLCRAECRRPGCGRDRLLALPVLLDGTDPGLRNRFFSGCRWHRGANPYPERFGSLDAGPGSQPLWHDWPDRTGDRGAHHRSSGGSLWVALAGGGRGDNNVAVFILAFAAPKDDGAAPGKCAA